MHLSTPEQSEISGQAMHQEPKRSLQIQQFDHTSSLQFPDNTLNLSTNKTNSENDVLEEPDPDLDNSHVTPRFADEADLAMNSIFAQNSQK